MLEALNRYFRHALLAVFATAHMEHHPQQSRTINQLPLEILDDILTRVAAGREIQVCLDDNDVARRNFSAPALVSRRFFEAVSSVLLPNVTLVGTNIEDPKVWIDRLALCPAGQIRRLAMPHNSWKGLMEHVESTKSLLGRASEAGRVLERAFSGLQHIELQFDILDDSLVRPGAHLIHPESFGQGILEFSFDPVGIDMIRLTVQVRSPFAYRELLS
jgi:hypothetical protein